jgi:tetratricopeptide (TPR) repeat protein
VKVHSSQSTVHSLVIGFALLVFTSTAVVAADISSEFDSANKLYGQGKFSEAVSAYEKMAQSGSVSAAVYFNLGNAFFKSGEVGRAIAAYRQAEKIAPRDPDVRANLQFIRNQIQGPTLSPSRWQHWLATLTVNEWAILASAALWLWLVALVVIQFRPGLKQSLRSFLWLGGVATIALGVCLGAAWSNASVQTAIVVVHDASVRSGPLEEAASAFTVHDGAELSVLDTKDDWILIRADDRHIGWLKREQAEVAP